MGRRHAPRADDNTRLLKIVTALAASGFVVLLIILAMQMAGGSSSGAGSRLAVDQEKIDFGRVPYEKMVRAVFTVKNVGDQPLHFASREIPVSLLEGC
jgi:hypothetical protein